VTVYWVIGLAGAGKTTLGRELTHELKRIQKETIFLDGDHFRHILGNDVGHTLEDRRINGWRMCRMCEFLDNQEINVVCSILSLFPEQREWNRQKFSKYFEIYLDVSMDILCDRDQKGLYSGAKTGEIKNVAGFDIEFIPPANPDYALKNDIPRNNFDTVVKEILKTSGKLK